MREGILIVLIILIGALTVCAFQARRSHKAIGGQVSLLLYALLPPVIGNAFLIASHFRSLSTVGYYIYFIGMDVLMFALLSFTFAYCRLSWPNKGVKWLVYSALVVDVGQLLCNPFSGHAFSTELIMVEGEPYYRLVSLTGQSFHRLVDYCIFFSVLLIFIFKILNAPRIYLERYLVILLTMVFAGAWQSFYIFSGTPIDRSMIGYGVFGLLVFYFSLYYRPLRLLDRMLAGIASEMPEALFFFDALDQCIWANQPARSLAGIDENEYEYAEERLLGIFGNQVRQKSEWCAKRVLGTGEDTRYYLLEKHTVTETRGKVAGSFLSIRDQTEEQKALQKEKYIAAHDTLTELYTKEHLYECIGERIRDYPEKRYLVLYVDVKDFKIVNDIFGNAFGDYALQCIANRIRERFSGNCLYGRIGGDTFGVFMPAAEFDAERVTEIFSRFVVTDGSVEHNVLIHLGVYEITESGLDVSVMFDRARLALSTVKDEFQTRITFYDNEMRDRVLWNQHISSQLSDAIHTRQIRPYLQPIVDRNGKVVGAEALVRWIHPVDGFLSPASFIPVFEKNGMIVEVDKYMWRCACEILAKWEKEGIEAFISVNISPKDFYFMDVAAEIKKVVKEYGVNPSRLRVEITETVMMTEIDKRIRILNELKEAGFLIEMDDFGSGYSSLNLLKDMPVDLIKIDMMFLNKSKNDIKARKILHNIISLSDDLGISSLTEGVETMPQYEMLSGMGCKLFQGYYFSKPVPVDEFEKICFHAA